MLACVCVYVRVRLMPFHTVMQLNLFKLILIPYFVRNRIIQVEQIKEIPYMVTPQSIIFATPPSKATPSYQFHPYQHAGFIIFIISTTKINQHSALSSITTNECDPWTPIEFSIISHPLQPPLQSFTNILHMFLIIIMDKVYFFHSLRFFYRHNYKLFLYIHNPTFIQYV